MNILVIEDNLQDVALLRAILSDLTSASIRVVHAERLSAAVSCLRAERFDGVLLDLNLPDSVGLDTFARVQAQVPTLPIVILTGLEDEPLAMQAVQRGAQDYVIKGRDEGGVVSRSLRCAVERKRAEQERAQALVDIQSVMRAIPDIVYALDAQGNLVKWNDRFVQVTGYSPEELLNKPALAFVPPEEQARTAAAIQQAFMEGYAELDGQLLTKDFRTIPYHWTGALLKNSHGEPIGITGIGRDVSDKKQAEVALREREERLALAVEGSTDILWDAHRLPGEPWYAPRTPLWWSPRVRELLDLEQSELFETLEQWAMRLHPDDKDCVFGKLAAHIEHRVPYDAEYRLRTNRGDYLWIRARGQASWDEQGEIRRMSGSCQDITERKRVEEERQKQEVLITLMLNTGPACIKRVAADGSLLYMNPTGLKLIEACGEPEVVGRSVFDLVIPEHRDAFISMHRSVIEGHARTLQFEIQSLKGTRRWMESYAVPFQNPVTGQTEQLAVTHDITERKWAEEALRASEQSIRALYEATAASGLSFDERVQAVLAVGCRRFKLPIGMRTQVVSNKLELRQVWAPGTDFTVGMVVPLENTYCNTTLQETEPVCFEHPGVSAWQSHPGYKALGLESYIGTKLIGRDQVYGTVCFTGPNPLPASFSQADKDFVQLMARWISGELDRQMAEQALKYSEERYRALYDDTPTMYFTLAVDGTVRSVNRFGAEQLGHQAEELIGHSVLRVFHEQDKEAVAASLSECLTTPETARHWEFRKIRKDGTVIWVRETACVRQSSTGETIVLVTCEDITERKQVETALRTSQEMLQLALHASKTGIWEWNTATGDVHFSKEWKSQLGYSESEVPDIFEVWESRLHPDDRARAVGYAAAYRDHPIGAFRQDFRLRHKDGTYRWIESHASFITESDGRQVRLLGSHTDISERKRTEEALRLSEQRYASLLNSVAGIVWEMDPATLRFTFVSSQAEHLLGYPLQQWYDDSSFWPDHIHPEDREWVLAYCLEQTKLGLPHEADYRMIAADGLAVWFKDIVTVQTEDGRPVLARGLMIDITKQKREREALAQLQLAVEQGMDGLALLRHDGCFIYMNPAFAAIYGYEVEELIGKPWQTLYGPEQQEVIKQYHWPFLELDGYWRGELVGRVKTGEPIDLDMAFQKLTSENTMQPDILCTCRDITDRKQAVRQERGRINLIQEHQVELLALAQNKAIFSGDSQQAFQAITKSVSRVLAVGRASIWLFQENPSAIRLADLYEVSSHAHSEGAILLADQFPAYFRALRQEQHTIAAYDAHIDPRTCEFAATYLTSLDIGAMLDAPIRHRGKVVGVLCHEHLGTSRMWTDDERTIAVSFASIATLAIEAKERSDADRAMIEAKQQAEVASAAKDTFLATMSHEIRTPMNAILGMAELLSETSLTEEQGKYVRIFRGAGHNLMVLLNDILDIAKVEAKRLELERISFDLHEVLEKVVDLLAIKANDKQVELTCYVAPAVPHALYGDPNRLQQILINLVGNAVKFTDQGSIELRVLPDPDVSEPGALLFVVADTGIGIPPDRLNSIFERFTQAHSSTTRLYGGTGLGLAICKEIVELMGGRIWAESHAGQGSTFLCRVKFEVAQDAAVDPVAATTDFNQLRVLVVDDNATNRLIAVEALAGWQAQAVEAPDGQSALRELRRAQESGLPYELILLDSRLPDLDGFEVVAHIREDASLRRLAIVMLTSDFGNGMGRSNDIARTYDLGLAGYLQKPITRTQLRRTITIALRRQQGLPPVSPDQTPTVPVDQRPLRILVVEDSLDNRLLMAAYLKSTPYQVDWAENGQIACDMAATNRYNLILMDMNMPVMDGYAATMAIRKREQTQSRQPTVILALTAYCSPEDTRRIITCGCDAHLTKPIAKAALRDAIATYAKTWDRPTASPNARQSPQHAA